ncbi:protein G12 [Xylocopa sonorina]|uniref:protein G12 n=1 Tax=Xylocopa sonorina TaxID=1818115 RepID=UPI00403A8816
MNPQIMMIGVVAAASVAFLGLLAYRIKARSSDLELSLLPPLEDNSSLEDDLKDVLAFVPMKEVQQIVERYMKYDAQIGDTVSFVDDQKRFILREFQKMPQANNLIDFLRRNGLDVDSWQDKIRGFWKTAPKFVRYDPSVAAGGLTVMINKILETMPLDELHELLRQKVKYSASFRRFLCMLKSKDFREFCDALENSDVLHHHYFWAKEGGLEITFAIELFNELYVYLTQTLVC